MTADHIDDATNTLAGSGTAAASNVIPFPAPRRLNPIGRWQAALDLFHGRNTGAIALNEAAARQLELLKREQP